jgi:hypothetical protein
MPLEWWRWKMAREMGWTLEYIDGLSLADMHQYWQVLDGEGKAATNRRPPGRKR